MLDFAACFDDELANAVELAGQWHDLGKLARENQAAMLKGRKAKLPVDHVDAGVAHLVDQYQLVAWLVRAHHAPGLPASATEKLRWFPLRGARQYRDRNGYLDEDRAFVEAINSQLDELVNLHRSVCVHNEAISVSVTHGLPLRLALSCLVDADHEDTAIFDRGEPFPDPLLPRWEERIVALDRYVAGLDSNGDPQRQELRDQFFGACQSCLYDDPMLACTGPVGIGKTTAVMAYLLRLAKRKGLRRIFIVAPYTNIISQTVGRLRQAVTLGDERGEEVVVEHHHRADYGSVGAREFATRWQAPIVVTTAVQFFETLSANLPGRLRKLHEVPGAAIFLDEAHAAIPVRLWPQTWQWLTELTSIWGCHVVFASGSLIKFWELEKINKTRSALRNIEGSVSEHVNRVESDRVRYVRVQDALTRDELCERILSEPGPRLVILNTVQSAAVIAHDLQQRGENVLHMSTALCPRDRERLLQRILVRLEEERQLSKRINKTSAPSAKQNLDWRRNWTLVATSCVEAGVDFSFQTAFREACSVASLIQVGGRVNRHGERGLGQVFSFRLQCDVLLREHPEFRVSADLLDRLFDRGELDSPDPSQIVTRAMQLELKRLGDTGGEQLQIAEEKHDYPEVVKLGRVIDADTCVVVVAKELLASLESNDRPDFRTLLRGSVQLWGTRIAALGLEPIPGFKDLYSWGANAYDPDFLGYMAGVLQLESFLNDPEATII